MIRQSGGELKGVSPVCIARAMLPVSCAVPVGPACVSICVSAYELPVLMFALLDCFGLFPSLHTTGKYCHDQGSA